MIDKSDKNQSNSCAGIFLLFFVIYSFSLILSNNNNSTISATPTKNVKNASIVSTQKPTLTLKKTESNKSGTILDSSTPTVDTPRNISNTQSLLPTKSTMTATVSNTLIPMGNRINKTSDALYVSTNIPHSLRAAPITYHLREAFRFAPWHKSCSIFIEYFLGFDPWRIDGSAASGGIVPGYPG